MYEELPGRVKAVRLAEIRPQVVGIVQHRLFKQGAEVKAGQPLFQIDPAPFAAEVDTAKANLQRAQVTYQRALEKELRLKPLVKKILSVVKSMTMLYYNVTKPPQKLRSLKRRSLVVCLI